MNSVAVAHLKILAAQRPEFIPVFRLPPAAWLRHSSPPVFVFAACGSASRRRIGGRVMAPAVCSIAPQTGRRSTYAVTAAASTPMHSDDSFEPLLVRDFDKGRSRTRAQKVGFENAVKYNQFTSHRLAGRSIEVAAVRAGISAATVYRWARRFKEGFGFGTAGVLTPRWDRCGRRSPASHLITEDLIFALQQLTLEKRSRAGAIRAWLKDNPNAPQVLREALAAGRLPVAITRATRLKRYRVEVCELPNGVLAVKLKDGRVIYAEPPQSPA